MLLALLFAGLSISGVLIIVMAAAVTRRKRRDVERRLNLLPQPPQKAESKAPPGTTAGSGPLAMARAHRLLLLSADHPWELQTTVAELALWAIAAAGTGWFLAHYLLGLRGLPAIALAMLAGFLAARQRLTGERKKLEAAFNALFPEAIDAVARMLRAGLPVTTAFQIVCEEAPSPVNSVFATLAGQLRIGLPIEDALRLSSQRVRLPDFQFFAVAILLQRSAGGNLLPTLEALSQLIRARRAVQLKARAVTAEIRLSAYVLGALPFVTIGALLLISPGYLNPLFSDPRGHAILGVAAAGLLLSAYVMRRMMRSIEEM